MATAIFITKDNRKFGTLAEAEAHEAMSENIATFKAYLKSAGHTRVSSVQLKLLQGWEEFRRSYGIEVASNDSVVEEQAA